MSTPLAEKPRADAPAAGDGTTSALAQDTSGSPKNFGLNVRRLRRTRIIVFVILAVPILALALLAGKFLSMPITQLTHQSAYENADYPAAIERLAPVEFANWFEPYLPHLSKGTDLLQQGQDAAAEEELRTAMSEWDSHSDLNSPLHAQCKIANNLAIAIERQADAIEDPQQRADRLYEAEEMLAACAASGGGEGEDGQGGGTGNEDSETTEDNGERVEEKRREADEEAGNDPDERGEQGGTPPEAGEPTREDPEGEGPDEEAPTEGDGDQQEKDDELEERNKESQGGEGETEPGGSNQDPEKPW
ncbi:hypothetical protein [Brachybacterium sp. FME24]|uniref:hypothetical protein n=1 Tax=Brachybacterium sp. FME24 TaxID=2742605 RepID=UPI00186692E6|nr:hypothetical protein [Brachybacterium sp. FME24]